MSGMLRSFVELEYMALTKADAHRQQTEAKCISGQFRNFRARSFAVRHNGEVSNCELFLAGTISSRTLN